MLGLPGIDSNYDLSLFLKTPVALTNNHWHYANLPQFPSLYKVFLKKRYYWYCDLFSHISVQTKAIRLGRIPL